MPRNAKSVAVVAPREWDALKQFSGIRCVLLKEQLAAFETNRQGSRGLAEKTGYADRTAIDDLLIFTRKIPGEMQPADFERWGWHLGKERKLKRTTQRKYQSSIRGFFKYLRSNNSLRNRVRAELGCDIVQVATRDNCITHKHDDEHELFDPKKVLDPLEIERFFGTLEESIQIALAERSKSALPYQRDYAMFSMEYACGLRAGENASLSIDDFSPNADLKEMGDFGQIFVVGKGSKGRTVPILHTLLPPLLRHYLKEVRPKLVRNHGERALWISERGTRLGYDALYACYKKHILMAGLRKTAPHSLRHTRASELIQIGMSLPAVQQFLGHEFASSTQVYLNLPHEYIRDESRRCITGVLDAAGVPT